MISGHNRVSMWENVLSVKRKAPALDRHRVSGRGQGNLKALESHGPNALLVHALFDTKNRNRTFPINTNTQTISGVDRNRK